MQSERRIERGLVSLQQFPPKGDTEFRRFKYGRVVSGRRLVFSDISGKLSDPFAGGVDSPRIIRPDRGRHPVVIGIPPKPVTAGSRQGRR